MSDKFNLMGLLKNAKKMQGMMEEAQEKLSHIFVEGEAGAGEIKVKMNAKYEVSQVSISDEILKEDKAILEELLQSAFNNAAEKAGAKAKEQMMDASKILGGGGLGDLFGSGSDDDKSA